VNIFGLSWHWISIKKYFFRLIYSKKLFVTLLSTIFSTFWCNHLVSSGCRSFQASDLRLKISADFEIWRRFFIKKYFFHLICSKKLFVTFFSTIFSTFWSNHLVSSRCRSFQASDFRQHFFGFQYFHQICQKYSIWNGLAIVFYWTRRAKLNTIEFLSWFLDNLLFLLKTSTFGVSSIGL